MSKLIEQFLQEVLSQHPPVIVYRSLATDEEPEPFVVPLDYGYEAES